MSIPQERLLSVLQAAEAFRQHYETIQGAISYEAGLVRRGAKTSDQALMDLALFQTSGDYVRSATLVIVEERQRYNYTHSKNLRERGRRARRQEEQGAGPKRGYQYHPNHTTQGSRQFGQSEPARPGAQPFDPFTQDTGPEIPAIPGHVDLVFEGVLDSPPARAPDRAPVHPAPSFPFQGLDPATQARLTAEAERDFTSHQAQTAHQAKVEAFQAQQAEELARLQVGWRDSAKTARTQTQDQDHSHHGLIEDPFSQAGWEQDPNLGEPQEP